jgi:hypothetical protein
LPACLPLERHFTLRPAIQFCVVCADYVICAKLFLSVLKPNHDMSFYVWLLPSINQSIKTLHLCTGGKNS